MTHSNREPFNIIRLYLKRIIDDSTFSYEFEFRYTREKKNMHWTVEEKNILDGLERIIVERYSPFQADIDMAPSFYVSGDVVRQKTTEAAKLLGIVDEKGNVIE